MTSAEFRAELAALGVTQTWLADRLKVKRQVVSRWANNGSGSPVPSWMPFLIELLRENAARRTVGRALPGAAYSIVVRYPPGDTVSLPRDTVSDTVAE